jgi:hypothetical protein
MGDRGHARPVWPFGGGRGGYFAGSIQDNREARLHRLRLLTLPLLLQQLVVRDGERAVGAATPAEGPGRWAPPHLPRGRGSGAGTGDTKDPTLLILSCCE